MAANIRQKPYNHLIDIELEKRQKLTFLFIYFESKHTARNSLLDPG